MIQIDETNINLVTNESYIGLSETSRDPKGFLTKYKKKYCAVDVTFDSLEDSWSANSKRDYIENNILNFDSKAYLFDSLLELLEWWIS